MRRVVITGMGPVSNIGIGLPDFTEALRLGKSGTGPIRGFDPTGFPHTLAGEVPDFRPEDLLTRIDPAEWGRSSQFAAAAARLAVADAGVDPADARTAIAVGTTNGELAPLVDMIEEWHTGAPGPPDPRAAAQIPGSRLGLAVAHELGATGETTVLGTACSAGNYALGYVYDLIGMGEADLGVAGGADSVTRFTHAGFHRLGAVAEEACRPFDRDRDGMLTAEGGVALVLEPLEAARERGATIYAEVLGYGMTCDAIHPTAPDADSIARCTRIAHRRSGVRPEQVDYICAHGTGTRTNDVVESTAMRAVFGDSPPPTSSIKSMMGHTMGAASGFGAIASALSIAEGFLPPTINHRALDPEIPGIDPVPNQSRPATVRVAQNNGFAFGGNNAIVLLGSVE
ncbi:MULTISPECIES: beta-ketoacyl synthase [Actinomadura]|uniref:Beta-ketoacyl-[acyl-carrier-protein] synthase family protein n=1 Tax=Actinomadura litoris TaxID=2678616 RepID=A0A7K1KXA5_9ACTN|nr:MULTISPECIES: beta-ketoacyl-[acyl-carrier-protein] synthase family protein [Actinomadura]MBT2210936.1 beta-ketoacyl-[acyl-carrier-protein] synthase family protein [Actinomadura sp. NEAU-AAG7]MUN36830.1 beta-ketoacyl-[acyl-carrier-protein] synthase family protein [Actinomadura litoris]